MKRFIFALVFLIFKYSIGSAQCPFNLGPDMFLCMGSPVVLNGPSGPGAVSYMWSTGQNTQSIIVFNPGMYWLIVTDSSSNTCSDSVLINFFPPISIALTCINNSCTQCSNGSITAAVNGGTPPYSYIWSNGAINSFIANLPAGTYTLTVADASGCTSSASCEIITGPVGTGPNLVSGNVFFDLDSNGIKGTGETGVPFAKVKLSPDGLTAFTDTSGNYVFLTDSGTHVIDFIPYPGLTLTAGSGTYNIQVTSGNYPGNDFSVIGQSSNGFAATYFNSGNPRCGNSVPYYIVTNTFINAPYLNGYIKLVIDSALAFNNASPPPSSVNGDTILWNFTANAGNNQLQFNCNLQIPLPTGYSFYTVLETVLLDSNNNIVYSDFDSLHQVVACSYDPNDKKVEPEGYGPQHIVFIDITPSLDYTIRFQNTGNDTAYNVVIVDTLDQAFDLGTFEFFGSSHPVQINMLNNLVEFRFDNIYLPDSNVNEPASHGFVRFRCNPLSQGGNYALENSAAIYFDLNQPVITNTTLSTIEVTVGIDELTYSKANSIVYPNPVTGAATILFENTLHENYELMIFDVNSRMIKKSYSAKNYFEIESDALGSGVYFYRIQNILKTKVINNKFIVTKIK